MTSTEKESQMETDDLVQEAQHTLGVAEEAQDGDGQDVSARDQGAEADTDATTVGTGRKRKEAPRPRARKKRRSGKKAVTAENASRLTQRAHPASTFEAALVLPQTIYEIGGGERVRRLTLFDHLGRSPESSASRQLVTNSSRYRLTNGSYQSEWLSLTEDGRRAVTPDLPARDRLGARFSLAIAQVGPFNSLYEHFKGKKLPTHAVLRDQLAEERYPADQLQEAVETFIVNAKFLRLLRTIAGAERLISIEQALEEVSDSTIVRGSTSEAVQALATAPTGAPATAATTDWDHVCFFISPIGSDHSEARKHSDMIMGSLVEPAVEELELNVVRADSIERPGFITTQVLEHLARSRLVVADLSFHNPNVFYELALRHASGRPAIHIIRSSDSIPFDLDQMRTIRLDLAELYTFVPQIETYRAESTAHARAALEAGDGAPTPLSTYYPDFTVSQN